MWEFFPGGFHKLRWQDKVYLGGTGNVNGMQIFPYNSKVIPSPMSTFTKFGQHSLWTTPWGKKENAQDESSANFQNRYTSMRNSNHCASLLIR